MKSQYLPTLRSCQGPFPFSRSYEPKNRGSIVVVVGNGVSPEDQIFELGADEQEADGSVVDEGVTEIGIMKLGLMP